MEQASMQGNMRMLEMTVAAIHPCWPEAQRGKQDEKCWLGCVAFFLCKEKEEVPGWVL